MKTNHIKSFKFGFARYHLSDGAGDNVWLNIDYKNNRFTIKSKTKKINVAFRSEIASTANDLLSRKHNTEFANKSTR